MPEPTLLHVIDSHTGGEPTRVVVSGGPGLGSGPLAGAERERVLGIIRRGIENRPKVS